MIKNKKALSTIIATLTIILLGLIAITMLWFSVKQLTERVALSPEISCFDMNINPPITIKSSCYNSQTKKIETELKRNLEDLQINSIILISDSNEWLCGTKCKQCILLKNGATKKYFLDSEEKTEKITLKVEGCVLETKEVKKC